MSYHPVNRHQGRPLQPPGEIKHPSQAINQAVALPDYFELPSKKSSAVTIKAPSAKATATQSEVHAPETKSDAAAISRLAPIVAQPSPTTAIETRVQKQLQEKPQSSRDGAGILTKTQTLVQPPLAGMSSSDESSAENVYPEPAKQVSKGSSAISAKDSSLNIYASIHVPDWLNAINESVAVSRPCQPLPRFNAQQYAILTGATIHVDAPVTAPPPASSAEALLAPWEVLSNENYFLYFFTRLNAEFAAFDKQLGNYSLYNHAFPLNNINQMLHEVRVPGLREFSPPVDLGDVVLVRPINPFPSGAAIMQNKRWRLDMQHHGTPHPLFNGIEYHAVVWRVSYTAEILLLCVDRNGGIPPNANFRFVVQAHKTQPLLRVINNTALAVSSAETLRSMLFPRKEDGRMQVELLRGSFDLEWKDDALNFEQQKAVANVVAENYGAVPYLISGPPGTGCYSPRTIPYPY
jgi:helicase MOV-10